MTTARQVGPPLETRRQPGGRRVLLGSLTVDLGVQIPGVDHFPGIASWEMGESWHTVVTVPMGFDTDFSSIPSLLMPVLGDYRKFDVAGVIHDFAYRVGVPRRKADRMWRIIARSGDEQVGKVRGFLGWAGLRVGGWWAYRRLRRHE